MEKYTVIIPTRDRAETLEFALKTCVNQEYANFQIIVSDNCSVDNTVEVVSRYSQPNVIYINPGRRVSMAENFEFALSHVDEGFVMFIGDDDGLIPGCIEYVAEIQKKYGVLAISGENAEYCWPNFPDPARKNLLKWGSSYKCLEIRSAAHWVRRCLEFKDIYTFDMPKLYHGFVHKSIIDKARCSGQYFNSITPDAYSAFATAFFIDKYAFSLRPFTIGGASGKSNGVSGIDPSGQGEESKKFFIENTIEFHPSYVSCASLEVYMAETFSQFADRFPKETSGFSVNIERMLRSAQANANGRTRSAVQGAVAEMSDLHGVKVDGRSLTFQFSQMCRLVRRIWSRIKTLVLGGRIPDVAAHGVHDVYGASLFISKSFK